MELKLTPQQSEMLVDFSERMIEDLRKSPKLRVACLREAMECLANGEPEIAKGILRDCIIASVGFEKLAKMVDKKPRSVMRMVSSEGNPSLSNISKLMASLHKYEGIEPQAKAE